MLRKRDITVGKFYVNEGRKIAREVLRTNSEVVIFNTYHLNTGYSSGSPSECKVQDFARWAEREASFAEVASTQYLEPEDQFNAPQPFN